MSGVSSPLPSTSTGCDFTLVLGHEGWRVVTAVTADVSTFWGTFWAGRGARQEIVVFLERVVE
jgi:hypothetical protein